ncbi:MAG: HAD family hydrolase [Sarcina sp.]
MKKIVIFDLDDTLYNEKTYVFSAFRNVSRYVSEKYKIDEDEVFNDIKEIFYRDGRGRIFNFIIEKYDLKEEVKTLVNIYRDTEPNDIQLYDDAREFIVKAKNEGHKLGIITDGMASVQWKKIRALRLESMVDKIVVSDDLGRENWKPSIVPYREILNHFGEEGTNAVYIGDNPNKDFIGARKLGIETVRIIRKEGDHMNTKVSDEYDADFRINLLSEYGESYV